MVFVASAWLDARMWEFQIPYLVDHGVPALIVHPDHDLHAPLELCERKTAQLVPHSTLRVYENAAHGLFVTHADQLNADLLAFAGVHRSRAPATADA
jgi:pimeloyl-ACP methyl ester carboxylesterase